MSDRLASVGQWVECINDKFPEQVWEWMTEIPVAGNIYTVAQVGNAADGITGRIGPGYKLEEFRNCGVAGGAPIYFSAYRFRLVEGEHENVAKAKQLVGAGANQRPDP